MGIQGKFNQFHMKPFMSESDLACFQVSFLVHHDSKPKPQSGEVTVHLKSRIVKNTTNTCISLQVLELDVMDVRIVEERSYAAAVETSSDDPHTAHIQRKHFLYFTDEKIFTVLMEICRTLGNSAI